MINKKSRNLLRRNRQSRVRKRVGGTTERPRLVVFRSLNHIYAQIIDDVDGRTLAAASSLDKSIKDAGGTFSERAGKVGELIGGKAQEAGIRKCRNTSPRVCASGA